MRHPTYIPSDLLPKYTGILSVKVTIAEIRNYNNTISRVVVSLRDRVEGEIFASPKYVIEIENHVGEVTHQLSSSGRFYQYTPFKGMLYLFVDSFGDDLDYSRSTPFTASTLKGAIAKYIQISTYENNPNVEINIPL